MRRGEALFHDARVMCSVCHTAPEFTNKTALLAPNDRRALPALTTNTRRDASYTLVSVRAMQVANDLKEFMTIDPEDRGRVEDQEGSFTTMQLRGIFDRPPTFLHPRACALVAGGAVHALPPSPAQVPPASLAGRRGCASGTHGDGVQRDHTPYA